MLVKVGEGEKGRKVFFVNVGRCRFQETRRRMIKEKIL